MYVTSSVCVYVCMYVSVRTYVRMYVCMYVCVCAHAWKLLYVQLCLTLQRLGMILARAAPAGSPERAGPCSGGLGFRVHGTWGLEEKEL